MKTSRVLGALLVVLEVASIGLFLVCGQTIFSMLSTVTPSGGGQIPVVVDAATQIATLTYASAPRNGGLLPVKLGIGFGITLSDGSYSVKNVTTVNLQPGEQRDVSLTLKVPVARLQQYANGNGTLNIYTSFSTLSDLVRLDYNALAEGGT
jgi:hypothetical protein